MTAACVTSADDSFRPLDADPRSAHPRHQRRHLRAPTRTRPRPHPQLPAHRLATWPQAQEDPEPNEGSGQTDVLRHHKARSEGLEPQSSDP